MAEQQFAAALRNLQTLLKDASLELGTTVHFALIGGLAVAAWGHVRATQDIDLLADCTPSPILNLEMRQRLAQFFERRGYVSEWHSGGIDDPIPLLLRLRLPGSKSGLVADILWAHKLWQREALERTVELDAAGMELTLIHPEDLILLKLDAGGPKTWPTSKHDSQTRRMRSI